jgi:hypothetical protein
MLKNKYITTKWNSKTKKYYTDLGYIFTKMGSELIILIEHLPLKSSERVMVKCDYCNNDYSVIWSHRVKSFEDSPIKKDACTNCKTEKVKESLFLQFGVENLMQVPEYFNKQRESCLESLGVYNPFESEEVKQKIRQTNYEKYGKTSYTQTDEYLEKRKQTNLERYNCEDFMQLPKYKEMFVGSKSPVWKGGINDPRWERLSKKYKKWRFFIFKRDGFICQKCGEHPKILQAHHIFNWAKYPNKRYDIENGISLCEGCHIKFHIIFGKKDNTSEQINIFLQER